MLKKESKNSDSINWMGNWLDPWIMEKEYDMPYGIRKSGNKFKVVNKNTGNVKGTHNTRSSAEKQRRLLEGIKHGWKPAGMKKKR